MTSMPPYVKSRMTQMSTDLGKSPDLFWDNISTPQTHAIGRHTGHTPAQMLDRMMQEDKPRVSGFSSVRDMRECVTEAIFNDFPDICRRLRKSNGKPLSHRVQLPDEEYQAPGDEVDFKTRHRGIVRRPDGSIREVSSDMTCVVLRTREDRPYGFGLVTATVDLDCESARPTGRNLARFLPDSEAYRKGSPEMRTYLDMATDIEEDVPDGMSIGFHRDEADRPDDVSIQFPSGNGHDVHRVYIDRDGVSLRSYSHEDGKYQPIPCTVGSRPCRRLDLTVDENWDRFAQQYPDAAAYVRHAEETLQEHLTAGVPTQKHPRPLPRNRIAPKQSEHDGLDLE